MWTPVNVTERLYYMDALRAFLMSYIVIVHAAAFIGESWGANFRNAPVMVSMGAFYVVSGLFTAYSLTKSPTMANFAKRFYFLLMPVVVLALLFNPVANYALARIAGADMGFADFLRVGPPEGLVPPLGISWHMHLWFLIVLAFFTALYPLLSLVLKSAFFIKILDGLFKLLRPDCLRFFAIACAAALCQIFLRGVYFVTLEPYTTGTPMNHILVSTCQYLPLFMLGMALFFYKPLFNLFHKFYPVQFIVSAAALILAMSFGGELALHLGEAKGELLRRTAGAFACVYATNALIVLFAKFVARPGKVLNFLSDASYTVYLFHLYILIAFFYFFYDHSGRQPGMFVLSILATYALCLALHKWLIAPFAVTRSLLNGKWPARSAAP